MNARRWLMVLALGSACLAAAPADPINVLFDTDMGGDCDDVGALFILHGAMERGEIRLLGTLGCISSDAIAPALDAINTWFGHPEIPVGTLKDPGLLPGPHYTQELAKRFPHKYASGKDYPDAVALYRRILAKQADRSVVIVAVGPLRNIANLLQSAPDAASPLSGKDLVALKVKQLAIMGGKYPPFASKKEGEWNFVQDPASTQRVCSTWPTPILFNGEGGSTCSGRRVTLEMPEHNPLTMAYAAYAGVGYGGDRLSWDPISCLVAVRGAAPWYAVVGGGANVADAKGINTWEPDVDRGHSYLVLKSSKDEVEAALEDLMTAGKGRPTNLTFNTAYYARDGMCEITGRGEAEASQGVAKAFDRDLRTLWTDKASASWIQCRYVDGRKYLVTSYAVTCGDRLPSSVSLSGSNDQGATWTLIDQQKDAGFTEQLRRREFVVAEPKKWNRYRIDLTTGSDAIQVREIELNEAIHTRPEVSVVAVDLDQKAVTLPVRGRATLNASVAPREAAEREVRWVSSDPSVAEVRRIGEQIAVVSGKKIGSCTVTAQIGGRSVPCEVTVGPSTLPPPWSFDEINAPPLPGAVGVADGTFTITGCGHGLTSWWDRVKDQGVFVNQVVSGDVELSARLVGLSHRMGNEHHATASGLLLKESLQPRSRNIHLQVDASGQLICRWRDKPEEESSGSQMAKLGKVTLPVHLKIRRSGGNVQVFTSADGKDWGEPRLTHPSAFSGECRAGLFVCSGTLPASSTATLDSVTLGR